MIKIVSFDIGNTLIKSPKGKSLLHMLEKETDISSKIFVEAYRNHFILKKSTLDSFCGEIGISPSRVSEVVNEYFNKKPSYEVWKEVPYVLTKLKEANIKLIAISNKSYCNPTSLQTYGLKAYFEREIYSCDVGYAKPDTSIFYTAVEGMECSQSEVLHVGDSYKSDYLGALSAGWKALLLDREEEKQEMKENKVYTIHNLGEILSLIKEGYNQ